MALKTLRAGDARAWGEFAQWCARNPMNYEKLAERAWAPGLSMEELADRVFALWKIENKINS